MHRLCSAVAGLPSWLMNPIPTPSSGSGCIAGGHIPVQWNPVGILHYATMEQLLSAKY
jgi:hypothetical protein